MSRNSTFHDILTCIQRLRVVGDTQGVARLMMSGMLTRSERRHVPLRPEELQAYHHLRQEARRVHDQRRTKKAQQNAYEALCSFREQGNIYMIVVHARKDDDSYRAVLTGVGRMPGVPPFTLNEKETEAVRLREEREATSERQPLTWQRIRGGEYCSTDWKWFIEGGGFRREWFVYCDGELWGHWNYKWRRRRYYEHQPEDYIPYESLTEAKRSVEEWQS